MDGRKDKDDASSHNEALGVALVIIMANDWT